MSAVLDSPPTSTSWRSRLAALLDLPLLLLPGIAAAPLALLLARRLHRLHWSELGLRRPESLGRHLALGVAAALLLYSLLRFVLMPILHAWLPAASAQQALGIAVGDWWAWLNWAGFMLLSAGIGEELVFRGYLMRRLAGAWGLGRKAWWGAAVASSTLFALLHFQYGASGVIHAGLVSLAFSALYLRLGRCLWPVMLAHASYDLISLTLMVSGFNAWWRELTF